jgi:hypothetical protein
VLRCSGGGGGFGGPGFDGGFPGGGFPGDMPPDMGGMDPYGGGDMGGF